MTTHVVFNSGGVGSWATLKRIAGVEGRIINLFTDTLIEDRDLYRFLIETTAEAYRIARPDALLKRCEEIPDIADETDVALRKRILPEIAAEAMRTIPGLVWVADGRTPWDVFNDVRYMGNSRVARCSHALKQDIARKWIGDNFPLDRGDVSPAVILYLGIDWAEDHRRKAPMENWAPYTVKFPMCDEPYVDKQDMLCALDEVGIARPRLYERGFAHNNCGGFCVRAGHGHFANLLEQFPEYFAYNERKEEEMRQALGKDVTVMKKERTVDGKRRSFPYSMRQLREDVEARAEVDRQDIGGCGCFVSA